MIPVLNALRDIAPLAITYQTYPVEAGMRAVVQRVLSASVVVDGKEISRINKGLMCLIGIGTDDGPSDLDYIAKKILNLKLFPDGEDETLSKQWAKSVMDIQGEVLCVSQFTLYASTRKGAKPDFHNAMGTEPSKVFYTEFLKRMGDLYSNDRIKDGEFGAMMHVSLTNEGPVTITLESKDLQTGNAGVSGNSTPQLSAEKQAILEAKQRKREENERRQRENLEKKKQAQAKFTSQKREESESHQANQ